MGKTVLTSEDFVMNSINWQKQAFKMYLITPFWPKLETEINKRFLDQRHDETIIYRINITCIT